MTIVQRRRGPRPRAGHASRIPVPWCGRALPLVLLACTVVPAPVVGPGFGHGAAPGGTCSVGWTRARARIADGMGREREIEGNGAHAWGDDDPDATRYQFPVPSMLSLHLGRPWWDGGAHAGWRRFGVTGRLRLFSIAEGATTSLALAANTHWRADAYDGSAALEQTVPLAWRLQLLLRAGVGGGRRNFAIVMPFDLDTTAGHDNTIGAAHLDLYRYDVRFEPVVGLVWRERLTLSVQPYTVLKHGGPQQVTCGLCVSGVRLLEFQESSGFAVALTLVLPEAVR